MTNYQKTNDSRRKIDPSEEHAFIYRRILIKIKTIAPDLLDLEAYHWKY